MLFSLQGQESYYIKSTQICSSNADNQSLLSSNVSSRRAGTEEIWISGIGGGSEYFFFFFE